MISLVVPNDFHVVVLPYTDATRKIVSTMKEIKRWRSSQVGGSEINTDGWVLRWVRVVVVAIEEVVEFVLLWLCRHGVLKLVVPVADVDAHKKILSHLGPTLKNQVTNVEFAKKLSSPTTAQ